MDVLVGFTTVFALSTPAVQGHGRLIEPPSRASMWRYGFTSPPDYNDHESYCGGFTRQWAKNGGRCGICGDAWDSPQPRAHEAGGTYGQGIIVRRYKKGSPFTIRVEITANHRGHFEFRLCKHNAPKVTATQHCLDQHVLRRAKNMASHGENNHPTRYYIGPESKVYEMRYMLPEKVTCVQCVLQWQYIAGNNWGHCNNTSDGVGCGPQEEFRACADIAIEDKSGYADGTPYQETEEEESDLFNNDVPQTSPEQMEPWYNVSLIIMLGAMFFAIFVYILLFVFYYGVNKTIKPCWRSTLTTSLALKRNKTERIQPIAPPRLKKLTSSNTVSVA